MAASRTRSISASRSRSSLTGLRHCVHRSFLRTRRARHHAATPASSSNRPITVFESKNSAASARAACWCRRGSRWIASTPRTASSTRAKRDQALADGVGAAEAGVLHERRLSRGEIPHGPIAEPAAVGGDVDALRGRAFGVRAQDVVVERLRIGDDAARIDDPPPVTAKQVQVACVGWMNVEGDLELGRGPLRQVDELPELVDLQPERRRTVLNGTVRPAPTRDRREPPGPRRAHTRVAGEDRGLTRVTPADVAGTECRNSGVPMFSPIVKWKS